MRTYRAVLQNWICFLVVNREHFGKSGVFDLWLRLQFQVERIIGLWELIQKVNVNFFFIEEK